MFRPEQVVDDGENHYYMRRKFNIAGNGFSHTIDTTFSTGWSGYPVAVRMNSSLREGITVLSLALDGEDSEYRRLLGEAKQVTDVSASRTLQSIVQAQNEEGAGLEESLTSYTERTMSRLVLAHIIQQRGFTLAHHTLARTLSIVASQHTPSNIVASHPAFNNDVFAVRMLENSMKV